MKNIEKFHRSIICRMGLSLLLILVSIVLFLSSCEKFVTVDTPESELITTSVFENAGTANGAVLAMFSNLTSVTSNLNYNLAHQTGLYSDELKNYSSSLTSVAIYENELSPTLNDFYPLQYWREGFKNIYIANAVIEGCSEANLLDENLKQQLISEAKFIRALWYFYLVNLFGDVPVITSTDWTANNISVRKSLSDVYGQIIKDLIDAKMGLNTKYVGADGVSISIERIRPNSSAASALLSRVYLYHNDPGNAEREASIVLDNRSDYDTVSLDQVFLKNSKEAIFQLGPSISAADQSTLEARNFILIKIPTTCTLSDDLLNSFETDDKRKSRWVNKFRGALNVDYFYPNKYKVRQSTTAATEYSTVLRVGELYLNRAEAKLRQGNIVGCREDINVVRKRAGLKALSSSDGQELQKAIIHERRVELFTEWGHRWLDIKRFGIFDDVMIHASVVKGGSWDGHKVLWPIPQSEISLNPKLEQNFGY